MIGGRRARQLLDDHDIRPTKGLGQNFLIDPNTIGRIVRLAGVGEGDRVLEIGPGLGSLTLGLLGAGASVTAVEIDRRVAGALGEVLAEEGVADRVRVVQGDALQVGLSDMTADAPTRMVSNLPYSTAVPIVLRLLTGAPGIERMLVMVQKEVAERLAAAPGGRELGIPTIRVAYRARARMVGTVGTDVFHPRPRVSSELVEIVRRPEVVGADHPDGAVDEARLWSVVERAFQQRRKMLRSTLGTLVSPEDFEEAGIDPADRPERLHVEDWVRLVRVMGAGDAGR